MTMGKVFVPDPVKLIFGVMWNQATDPVNVISFLENTWGEIESQSVVFDFGFTDYYLDESGPNLKKQYIALRNVVDINHIPEIKINSNILENKFFTLDDHRSVNLDPGYISEAKLVMATTKNLPHRVYIGLNMFADLQMIYKKPSFRPTPWAFGDIKQDALIAFFNEVRENYMRQLKSLRANAV